MTHIYDDARLIDCARMLAPHDRDDMRRLANLIYLADWRCTLTSGHQITRVSWTFSPSGPNTGPVELCLAQIDGLRGGLLRRLFHPFAPSPLEGPARAACAHVARSTADLDPLAFHRLVISTWPVITCDRHDQDPSLETLALEYAERMPA